MTPRPLLLLLVCALTLGALPAAATIPATPSVLVLGDSYASGEGLPSAEGPCGVERERSWGAIVADELGASDLQLLACSGAEVADVTVGGELGLPAQLEAATRADLVLLTISGNDLGFTEIVADCLGFAELRRPPAVAAAQDGSWADLVADGGPDRGCEVTPGELIGRIEGFAAPERFLVAPGATGSLAQVYEEVVARTVADGGRLVVVGYPALFAPVDDWPERYGRRCHGLLGEDARDLSTVVTALDDQLAAAAEAADEALGGGVVTHLSVLPAFAGRDSGSDHRLCSGATPWVNGLTVVEGGVDVARLLTQLGAGAGGLDLEELGARPGGSFHPGTAGHRGIAATVLDDLGG